MKVLGWLTHCVKKNIALDFVSGDNFFRRVLIYPNTFIQEQYVYNIYLTCLTIMIETCHMHWIWYLRFITITGSIPLQVNY
jgi:hypothetical protein